MGGQKLVSDESEQALTTMTLQNLFLKADKGGDSGRDACKKGSLWRLRQSSIFFAHFQAVCRAQGSDHYE